MISFPCAKINLGLNIVSKRPDGYHNLETVFYPIPITDALEITPMSDQYPANLDCDLSIDGAEILGDKSKNLVVKAYNIINEDHPLPRIHAHLYKRIPMQAGLGGGSSDAAYMLRLLNDEFNLQLTTEQLQAYAARLGADCAFFINAKATYAEGIGEIMSPISADEEKCEVLKGYWVALVKPEVAVSTKEAFSGITPKPAAKCCREIVLQPIETWRDELINDFEESIFRHHPELAEIKEKLYENGAIYAAMSGSGSTLFGIYRDKPDNIETLFPECETHTLKL